MTGQPRLQRLEPVLGSPRPWVWRLRLHDPPSTTTESLTVLLWPKCSQLFVLSQRRYPPWQRRSHFLVITRLKVSLVFVPSPPVSFREEGGRRNVKDRSWGITVSEWPLRLYPKRLIVGVGVSRLVPSHRNVDSWLSNYWPCRRMLWKPESYDF